MEALNIPDAVKIALQFLEASKQMISGLRWVFPECPDVKSCDGDLQAMLKVLTPEQAGTVLVKKWSKEMHPFYEAFSRRDIDALRQHPPPFVADLKMIDKWDDPSLSQQSKDRILDGICYMNTLSQDHRTLVLEARAKKTDPGSPVGANAAAPVHPEVKTEDGPANAALQNMVQHLPHLGSIDNIETVEPTDLFRMSQQAAGMMSPEVLQQALSPANIQNIKQMMQDDSIPAALKAQMSFAVNMMDTPIMQQLLQDPQAVKMMQQSASQVDINQVTGMIADPSLTGQMLSMLGGGQEQKQDQ